MAQTTRPLPLERATVIPNPPNLRFQSQITRTLEELVSILTTLEELNTIELCTCKTYVVDQLEIVRRQAQELDIVLDRLILVLIFEDRTFEYLPQILFSRCHITVLINDLTLILQNDDCTPAGDDCERQALYNQALENAQLAFNNIIAVTKFLEIEEEEGVR